MQIRLLAYAVSVRLLRGALAAVTCDRLTDRSTAANRPARAGAGGSTLGELLWTVATRLGVDLFDRHPRDFWFDGSRSSDRLERDGTGRVRAGGVLDRHGDGQLLCLAMSLRPSVLRVAWTMTPSSDQTIRLGVAAERSHAIPRRRVSAVIENRTLTRRRPQGRPHVGRRLSQIRTPI